MRYRVEIFIKGRFEHSFHSTKDFPIKLREGEEVVYNTMKREVVGKETEIYTNGNGGFITVRYYLN